MKINANEIYFTPEELEQAKVFANKIKNKHGHFADKNNTSKRTPEEVYESVIMGKLGEMALYKYLKSKHKGTTYEISDLDFNVYGKGICDSYDLKFNNHTISIKSSKPFASCLLIETEKYQLNEEGEVIAIDGHEDNIPDYYAFVKVNIDNNKIEKTYASICGAISHRAFWEKKKVIPRGTIMNKENLRDFLINEVPLDKLKNKKGTPLLATNYGIHLESLKQI